MTTSDASSSLPNSPSSAETPPVPRRSLLRRLLLPSIFVALFAGAFLVSWLISATAKKDSARDDSGEDAKTKRREAGLTPAEILARGDESLQQHRFTDALANYADLLDSDKMSAPLVEYRIGRCNESLGQPDKAIACYRACITSAPQRALQFACHLGISRCLLQKGRFADARKLTCGILTDEAKQQGIPAPLLCDARFIIALAFARETYPHVGNRPILEELATSADAASEVPFHLDEIGTTTSSPPPPASPNVIKKNADIHAVAVVRFAQTKEPAQSGLDKLAAEAGIHCEWTAGAKRQCVDRIVEVDVRDWPLVPLVEILADGLDLACRVEKNVVHLSTREELDAPAAIILRRETAHRALRLAIATEPGHRLAPASLLELGNLEMQADRIGAAVRWNDQLLREAPASPQAILACYNLGQIHMRRHAFAHARMAYFRAIDHAPGHEFALRAYLRLGHHCFEEDDAAEAIRLLRRAESLAPESPRQPMVALNLAAAYLSQGKFDEARRALERHRAALHRDPFKPTAAFLDSYARYKLAQANQATWRDGTDLIANLWNISDPAVLGPLGPSLMAQAYTEFGFWEPAERLLRQASKSVRPGCPLSIALDCKLGEVLAQRNQGAEARALFERVTATSSPHRSPARLHLAQLDLAERRWQECAVKCKQLWQEKAFAEPMTVLRLWGAALEGAGDFVKAAECYQGKAPE